MFFDPIYLFFPIPALAIVLWAIRRRLTSRRAARSRVISLTGGEAAFHLLRSATLGSLKIVNIDGNLTDMFDPQGRVLRLSTRVHHGGSLDAVAVALHEAGQAVAAAGHPIQALARGILLAIALYGSSLFWLLLASSFVLTNVPFYLAAVAVLTINVALQVAGLWLEGRAEREIAAHQGSGLGLESDDKAILDRACRSEALRSLTLTLTGTFRETIAVAYHKLLR